MEPAFPHTSNSSNEKCQNDSSIQHKDNPVSVNFNKDRIKLLYVFPEEIWKIILSCCITMGEFENVCNTAGYMRTLLLGRRTECLFPSVYSILEPYFDAIRTTYHNTSRAVTQNYSTLSKPKKGFSNILKCRLVCKAWCEAVDRFYQSEEAYATPLSVDTNEWACENTIPHRVKEFVQHFENTHNDSCRNPFLARRVCIKFSVSISYSPKIFPEQMDSFLKQYGKHIWYCTLCAYDSNLDTRTFSYNAIKLLLEWMPNLKMLDISYKRLYFRFESEMLEQLDELQQCITQGGKLPTLKNLTTLKTENLLTPMFHEIVLSNSHITRLVVNGETDVACDELYEIQNMKFPSLKHLSLKFDSKKYSTFPNDLKQIWNLETFEMEFTGKY